MSLSPCLYVYRISWYDTHKKKTQLVVLPKTAHLQKLERVLITMASIVSVSLFPRKERRAHTSTHMGFGLQGYSCGRSRPLLLPNDQQAGSP